MRAVIMLSVVWLLTACAGQSQQSTRSVVDWEQVGKIEAAHGTGATPSRIIWVNPPTKRVPVDSNES